MYPVQLAREYYFEPLQNAQHYQTITKTLHLWGSGFPDVLHFRCFWAEVLPRFSHLKLPKCRPAPKCTKSPKQSAKTLAGSRTTQNTPNPGIFEAVVVQFGICWVILGIFEPARVLANWFGYFSACRGFLCIKVAQMLPGSKTPKTMLLKPWRVQKTPKIRKMPNIQNLWQLLRFGVFWCHFRLWKFGDKVEPANTFETWLGPHLPDPSLHKGSEGRSWGLCIYI